MEFSPKKATTTKKCCSVPQCSSMAERDRTLSFHMFPKENETVRVGDVFGNYAATGRRKEWARLLKIGKPVSKCMYVCSKHFTADNFRFPDVPAQKRYLKFNAIPSENLPQLPTRSLGAQTTRHLDRRKKREPDGSVHNVPHCSLNTEENEPESSRAAAEAQQAEVKVEPLNDWEPLPIVFVKTEVTDDDDDYGGARQPATGLDLIAASSYSAAVNTPTKSEADRPDFRFVDVSETVTAPPGRAADVDPLELPGSSLPEPSIKREPPDETEAFPPEPTPHLTPPPHGHHDHAPTDAGVLPSASGSILICGPVIVMMSNEEQCAPETRKCVDETNGKETVAFENSNDTGGKPHARDPNLLPQRLQFESPSRNLYLREKPYGCDVCHAKFNRASDLNDHRGLHGHRETYSCDVCKATYTQGSRLAAHKRLHKKTYSCNVCRATFTQSSSLAVHKRLHRKSFSCDVCKAFFAYGSSLAAHMRLHGNTYSCNVCKATFTEGSSLVAHKRLHGYTYSCDVCKATFLKNSSLAAHRRLHGHAYSCDVCKATFLQGSGLAAHKRCHGKTYSCDVCMATFPHGLSLAAHRQYHVATKPCL